MTGLDGDRHSLVRLVFPQKDQAFKYLRFVVLDDSADLKNELVTGDVDIIISQDQYAIDNTTHDVYTAIDETEGFTTRFEQTPYRSDLIMNIQGDWPTVFGGPGNFPVSQSWFRRAVSHAIDRKKLVSNSYKGFAYIADSPFFDETERHFSNLNTSDFYNYSQGWEVAAAILDSNGYTPLGFADEPDNRFGYGPYANETEIEGQVQSKGRHFWLVTTECPTCEIRIESIREDLRKIGIYVDISTFDNWWTFYETVYGDPGSDYNTSYIPLGKADPAFRGPLCDFAVLGLGLFNYPHHSFIYFSHGDWYNNWYGGTFCG
ncbi:MAG: ABC transporter substrate-binding protein, partial [Candidatus Hodarchaeales archaeon]